MSRPRFSEMLSSRRQQLGLSIEQASRILKLREDVLIASEEGDFDRMPQSGYAQGMLSSYARYLGLNPREVVDYFQEELYESVNGSSSHELRRRTRDAQMGRGIKGYDVVNEVGSRPKAYVEYHGLLPTAGGPAGDMGAFATTTPAKPRRSVPLAGSGPSAASAYAAQQAANGQRRPYNSPQRTERAQSSYSNRAERQRRRNAQRRRSDISDPSRRLLSSEMQGLDDSYYDVQHRDGGRFVRDDVSTRNVRPREYTDDMRFDDRANPYERASTISGRRSSRNIANMERPNVRRRSGSDYAPSGRGAQGRAGGGSNRRRSSGPAGAVQGFFSDPRRSIFAIVVLLCVILMLILSFAVSSCVNKNTSAPDTKAVTVNSNAQTDEGSTGTGSTSMGTTSTTTTSTTGSDASSTTQQTSTDTSGSNSAATYVPTVVKVSVQSGSYTWLEITCDGKSAIADSVTGPWEQEFTVTDSLTVQAGDPSAVTVTNNGANVSFTSKASGLGSLSVKGTKPPETTTDDAGKSSDGSASADGTAAATSTETTE